MMKESQHIPTTEDTREVFVRTIDGLTVLVLVGHDGRHTSVPVLMRDTQRAIKVAA
jgi:hypothetical protein